MNNPNLITSVQMLVYRVRNTVAKIFNTNVLHLEETDYSKIALEKKLVVSERIRSVLLEVLERGKDIRSFRYGLEKLLIERNTELKSANQQLIEEIANRKAVEEELKISNEQQKILNSIVKISMKNMSFQDQFELILDEVLSIPWLPNAPKGGIFLVQDDPDMLTLKTHRNFPQALQTQCSQIPFGFCLCGRAASTGNLEFALSSDKDHVGYGAVDSPHSHYSVPIKLGKKIIGVLALHLSFGHQMKTHEENFLKIVANTLAGILERKRVEKELRVLSRAVEQSPSGVVITDTDGNIEYVNPRFTSLTGYTSEEVMGKNPRFLKSGQMSAELYQKMWETISSGGQWHGEFHNIKKNGELYWEFAIITPIRNPEDQITHYLSIKEDITERKKSEEELKELALFAEMNPAPVVRLGRNSSILLINNATSIIFENKDLIGKSWLDVCPGIKKSRFRKILSGTDTLQHESKIGDRIFLFTYKGNPESDYIYVYGADITLQKHVEAELKRARDIAVESSSLKSEFLANMSHEIRTPMNGVLGMTDLLLSTQTTIEQREYIETINSSGKLLLSIINDILDLSKIEAGKLQLEATNFNLRTMIEDVVELHAAQVYGKGLEFNCLLPNDLITAVKGDPTRLQQVLSNLLNNAIKFTHQGHIMVFVELIDETERTINLRFKVKDTGIGIAYEGKQRLFKYFSQLDGSTTRKYGGTGLGLAISKQLVEIMGGEIGVDSEPEVGSTFWFNVELEKQLEGATTLPPINKSISRLKILMVDEKQTSINVLKRILSKWDISYHIASDCHTAANMLHNASDSSESFDVIIVDLSSQCVGADSMFNAINFDPVISNTKIIILTPPGRRIADKDSLKPGMHYYLHKPIRQSRLYNCLIEFAKSSDAVPNSRQVMQADTNRLMVQRDERILIVEDDTVNQKVTSKMLEILGYTNDIAANGLLAIEAMARNSYNLIFMDCQMPEMDGFEVTKRIRKIEKGLDSQMPIKGHKRHVPIIALTANAMQGDKERCQRAGMDDYLSKPLKQTDLEKILNLWLKGDRQIERQMKGISSHPSHATTPKNDPFTSSVIVSEPIDPKIFNNLKVLMGEGLKDLIAIFIDDTEMLIGNIIDAIEKQDMEKLGMFSHRLKSSSANVGALILSKICKSLEEYSHSNENVDYNEIASRLKEEYSRAKAELLLFK